MYNKLKDVATIYFDVDDTLVLWRLNPTEEEMSQITLIEDETGVVPVLIHHKHVEILKKHKHQGEVIVVWSQGGSDWAEAVVRTLNLEDYVDIIIAKPTTYYDDLSFQEWAPPVSFEEYK